MVHPYLYYRAQITMKFNASCLIDFSPKNVEVVEDVLLLVKGLITFNFISYIIDVGWIVLVFSRGIRWISASYLRSVLSLGHYHPPMHARRLHLCAL